MKYSTWNRWTWVGSWVGAITLLFVGYAIAEQLFVASYNRTLFAFGCGFAGRYIGRYLAAAILSAPTEDDRLIEKDPWRTKGKE